MLCSINILNEYYPFFVLEKNVGIESHFALRSKLSSELMKKVKSWHILWILLTRYQWWEFFIVDCINSKKGDDKKNKKKKNILV